MIKAQQVNTNTSYYLFKWDRRYIRIQQFYFGRKQKYLWKHLYTVKKPLKNRAIDDQTIMETFNPLNMWWWSCISAHSHFQHEEGGRKKGEKQMFTECICECWHLLTTHCSLDPLSWDCCWLKSQQLALLTVHYGQHTYKTQLKLFIFVADCLVTL